MFQNLKKRIVFNKNKFLNLKEENEVKNALKNTSKPIYHVHIRKTAGTTINFAFLSNTNESDIEEFYEDLAKKQNHRIIRNNKVFVGWNSELINDGKYSYAFSHKPLHQLNLPEDIFLFTCLRDPVKRVISHYNMLMFYQNSKINHPAMRTEGKLLGNSFDDFLKRLPKEQLLNQIYMFSPDFDIEEAFEKLQSLQKILYTEDLKNGLDDLEKMVGWQLPISNQKKYNFKAEINESQIAKLQELMEPEYLLFEKLKKSE